MESKSVDRPFIRRVPRLRPYHRVLIVTMVALLGAGVGFGVMMAGSKAPLAAVTEVTARLDPIDRELAVVEDAARMGESHFQDALSASDAGARTAALQAAETATQDGQKAWATYRNMALGLRGEKKLQVGYEKGAKESRDAGVLMFTTDAQTRPFEYAAAAATLRTSGQSTQRNVEALRVLYQRQMSLMDSRAVSQLERLRREVPWVVAIAVLLGLTMAGVMLRGAVCDERRARDYERDRERQIQRSDLETRVQRGLEMTRTEQAAYDVVGSALHHVVGENSSEMLVADSSRAHFRQVLSTGPAEHGCTVSAPTECPVAHTGQVRIFENSEEIDACPFLRERPGGACSAACVPVSVAGRSIGVIHVVSAVNDPPSQNSVMNLSLVAQRAGEHIGLLRAMARSETQAGTDSLTGLLNRRSIEASAHQLVREGTPFVVAFADLDHFKVLNDTHGHESGDRALRLFARVLRDSVRPTDIPARYGGEEFVVVLPDCTVHDAVAVAERLRARLGRTLENASVPPFTVSVGIARSGPDNGLTETIARADEALLSAKAAGRDRVCVFPADQLEDLPENLDEPEPEPVAPPALRLHA